MTFFYGFLTGGVSISLIWAFFHAKIKAELRNLRETIKNRL